MSDTTKSQQGRPAQPSYQDTLDGVIRHLDATDEATVAVALATLSILLTQSNEEANLKGLVPRLLELLSAGGSQVKRNAATALSAALAASDAALEDALDHQAAELLFGQLRTARDDAGLTLNLLAAVGSLVEGSPAGALSIVQAGGVEAMVTQCGSQQPQQQPQDGEAHLQEAAVDILCKLLGHGEEMRMVVAGAGGIPALASLLSRTVSAEVRVRCLLGLGMLVGDRPERQQQLAAAPGAAAQLVALMRQADDADCQQIAASIFAELAKNPAAKEGIAAALKGSH